MKTKFILIILITFFIGCKNEKKNEAIINTYNEYKYPDNKANYLPKNFDKEFFNRDNVFQFFESYKNCNYKKIYNFLDDRLKKKISEEDFKNFFQIL